MTEARQETVTLTLDEAIQRGDTAITQLILRRPRSGALRGVSLLDLVNMNVAALQVVLPRITEPALTQHDVANLDPADLLQIGTEVSYFLAPKAERRTASPAK
jgi:hypothetical protein